jgi:hypothetical protein
MMDIVKDVPLGGLTEVGGAIVRNQGDTLNVMNRRPPCLYLWGFVRHVDGKFLAESKNGQTTEHETAREALQAVVQRAPKREKP